MPDQQIALFSDPLPDPRPPAAVGWNLWHGCTKVSTGCAHCYMYRRDEAVGRDPTVLRRTRAFRLPAEILRAGEYRGLPKIPSGSRVYTCFSSDFFHEQADGWRREAWDMIRERSDCTFFMITKRPEMIASRLPDDWGGGWEHVTIAVTCENQAMAERRLPVYLSLPLRHRAVMIEPMLTSVDLRRWLAPAPQGGPEGGLNGEPAVESVSVGGESGPDARPCDFAWVLDVRAQCAARGVAFSYHQTGARLVKDGREYRIPRARQHEQARKAALDLCGGGGLDEIPGESASEESV